MRVAFHVVTCESIKKRIPVLEDGKSRTLNLNFKKKVMMFCYKVSVKNDFGLKHIHVKTKIIQNQSGLNYFIFV